MNFVRLRAWKWTWTRSESGLPSKPGFSSDSQQGGCPSQLARNKLPSRMERMLKSVRLWVAVEYCSSCLQITLCVCLSFPADFVLCHFFEQSSAPCDGGSLSGWLRGIAVMKPSRGCIWLKWNPLACRLGDFNERKNVNTNKTCQDCQPHHVLQLRTKHQQLSSTNNYHDQRRCREILSTTEKKLRRDLNLCIYGNIMAVVAFLYFPVINK